jgi:transposase
MAKHSFVLLPRRCVVEQTFALAARFHRLAGDYERLDPTFKGLHFVILMCARLIKIALATS